MTQTGSIMGTAQYLSPEQAQGHAVGATSDLYSVGIILYEMLTGRVPFEGDSAVAIALKQVSEAPVPPSALNPAVTPGARARRAARAGEGAGGALRGLPTSSSPRSRRRGEPSRPADVDDDARRAAGRADRRPRRRATRRRRRRRRRGRRAAGCGSRSPRCSWSAR